MNCGTARKLLARRLDGDLAGAELEALDRHLESCGECRRASDEIAGTLSALGNALSATRPAPSRLSAERRREILEAPPRPVAVLDWLLRPHRALAAATAVLVAGGSVVLLVRHMEFRPADAPPRVPATETAQHVVAPSAARPASPAAPFSHAAADGEDRLGKDRRTEAKRESEETYGANRRDETSARIAGKLARSRVDRSATAIAGLPEEPEATTGPQVSEPQAAPATRASSPRKGQSGIGEDDLKAVADLESADLVSAFAADRDKAKVGEKAGEEAGAEGVRLNVVVEGTVSPADPNRRLIHVKVAGDAGKGRIVLVSARGALWRVDSGAGPRAGERAAKPAKALAGGKEGGALESAWFELQVDPGTPDSAAIAEVRLRSEAGDRVLHRIRAGDVAAAFESARAAFREEASAVAAMLAPAGMKMAVLSESAREADVSAEAAADLPDPAPMDDF